SPLIAPAHRSMAVNDTPPEPPPRRAAGPLQIASAVFWGFFGVRKQQKLVQDVTTIKPHHIVIAAIIGAALFVMLLLVIVRPVVATVEPDVTRREELDQPSLQPNRKLAQAMDADHLCEKLSRARLIERQNRWRRFEPAVAAGGEARRIGAFVPKRRFLSEPADV